MGYVTTSDGLRSSTWTGARDDYIGRSGTERVAVPPLMLKTDDNPGDGIRAGSIADRARLFPELADGPFFGNNRPAADVSQGVRDTFWLPGMQSGHRSAYECRRGVSATDFRGDLAKFDVPILLLHGDDDQIVPFEAGGKASAALVDFATLKGYPGAPHRITTRIRSNSTPTCSVSSGKTCRSRSVKQQLARSSPKRTWK